MTPLLKLDSHAAEDFCQTKLFLSLFEKILVFGSCFEMKIMDFKRENFVFLKNLLIVLGPDRDFRY